MDGWIDSSTNAVLQAVAPEPSAPSRSHPGQHGLRRAIDDTQARAVRRWLAEAWRHGEVVADDDRATITDGPRPIDRFAYHCRADR